MRGEIERLSFAEGLRLTDDTGNPVAIKTEDLVAVDFDRESDPFQGRRILVNLQRGDRLFGNLVQGDDDGVTFDSPGMGRVKLPLEQIRSIQTGLSREAAHRDAANWFLRQPLGEEDAVLLTNGDVATGFITRVESDGIGIETAVGESKVDFRLIIAARFVAGEDAQVDGMSFLVSTVDQSRLTCRDFEMRDGKVQVTAAFGAKALVPADRLMRIEVIGGRWIHLTALTPISYEQVPMLSIPWPWVSNRNVMGKRIQVAGESYDRGLGVHSRAVLVYELGGQFSEFVTAAGLDDASGAWADVSIAILLDGQALFEREGLRRGELIGPMRFDVSRGRSLSLICDYGKNGDIQDRFNWIAPALIRKAPPNP